MAAAGNPNLMIFPGLDGSPVRLYYVFYPSNTFFVTQDDKVWAMGSNLNERCSRPVEVKALSRKNVRSFAHGSFHVLALTENGDVYAWGDELKFHLDFQLVEDEIRKPTLVYNGKDDPALEIACGDSHSALRTKNGNVYCWGQNNGGQLGTGNYSEQEKPLKVPGLPKDNKCTGISCQAYATVAVFEGGEVYFWGTNGDGERNKAPGTMFNKPEQVLFSKDNFRNIKKVASGPGHTLALAEDGSLYVWGENNKFQLGLGTKYYRTCTVLSHKEPSSPKWSREWKVIDITACRYTSAAMTEDSKVLVTGDTTKGEMSEPIEVSDESLQDAFAKMAKVSETPVPAAMRPSEDSKARVLVWGDTIEGERSVPIVVGGESLQDAFAKMAKDFETPVPVVGGFPSWTRLSLVRGPDR